VEQATPNGHGDVSREVAEELTALRAIVEGTARSTGEEFFRSLVRHLAGAVDAHYAFVAEFTSPETTTKARTLAFWAKDRIAENYEWTLAGTPCEEVVHGNLCHHASGVQRSFPNDRSLAERRIESYLGVPLSDPEGKILGHLAVFDDRPMPEEPRKLLTFHIFTARAAAELVHLRLERQLRESEERLRDLYEEAPIAYVKEDLESRFISANRAAQRILGLKPEEVVGTGHEKGAFSGAPSGPLRVGQRRDDFPGRGGRSPARRSGQTPPRAPGTRVRARRRIQSHQNRCPRHCGNEPGSREVDP
jgi:PAS domain-containing protein